MTQERHLLFGIILFAAAIIFTAQTGEAAQKQAPIEYGALFTGKDAPPGAMKKMRRAAQLAARGEHCAEVGSGSYIPPNEQFPEHKDEPYMVTCKASDSRGYYNVYFGDADLAASHNKDREKPVSQSYALSACRKTLLRKFPTAHLNGFRTSYDASKSTSNVLQKIALTVENGFGVRVERVGNCTITPNGNLSLEDVWLTMR